MNNYMDAARLQGWKTMHVSDSRRMVKKGDQYALVGDSECKGWPDLFLCHPASGRTLAVEVKRETEDPTPDQAEWLAVLATCGIPTFVLRPSTYDAALVLLRSPRRARVA